MTGRQPEVADFSDRSSPQPGRVPVRARVEAILAQVGRKEKSGYPLDFTHRELARTVYAIDEPTAAHESAIRRAVAKLVAAGRVERITVDRMINGYEHGGTGWHTRLSPRGYEYVAHNPAGIVVRRVLTVADREARAQVAENAGYTEYAASVRSGDRS